MFALYNFTFLVIGYLFGSISTAIILTKIVAKQDIRQVGSNNAGATNVTMTLGKRYGALILALDVFKTLIAYLICFILHKEVFTLIDNYPSEYVYMQMSGVGAILGHIYPLYFKFKGGKGASIILGYFTLAMWILVPVALFSWITIAFKKKSAIKASLIVITSAVLIYYGLEIMLDLMDAKQLWLTPLMFEYPWYVNVSFLTVMWVTAILKQLKVI